MQVLNALTFSLSLSLFLSYTHRQTLSTLFAKKHLCDGTSHISCEINHPFPRLSFNRPVKTEACHFEVLFSVTIFLFLVQHKERH